MNGKMSSVYWVAICVAVLLSTIGAVPVQVDDQEARLGLLQHQRRVTQFRCAAPQPRSYKIAKILPFGEIATTDVVFPLYTVIRTCDEGTGCCSTETKVCAPISTEDEEVQVRVSDVVNTGGRIRTLKITHHKECRCQPRSEVLNSSLPPNITLIN